MLTRVRFQGFKAIKDSGLVDLHDLTLLIGRNGAGKSSLIEALQWLHESLRDGLEEATGARFRSFDDICNRRARAISVHLALGRDSREVRYDLTVRRGPGHRPIVRDEWCQQGRTRAAKTTISTKAGKRGPAVRSILGGNPVRDGDALALAFATHNTRASGAERLLQFLRQAVFLRLSPTAMAVPSRMQRRVRGPTLDEEGRELVALLMSLSEKQRQWIGSRISEVISGVEGVRVERLGELGTFGTDERMLSRGGKRVHFIPAWLLSEGTRRLTAIFALLAVRPRPSLIAIEEVENGFDPWTLEYVFKALREASEDGVQVIVTTHSPFLLDHVDPGEVIHVTREHGETRYTRIEEYADVINYKGVLSPGAMYISGYLRGRKG